MKKTASVVKKTLARHASVNVRVSNMRFFKTGKGEYGEGDVFIGVTVPVARTVAKEHIKLSFPEVKKLLKSSVHEHRLTALLILVERYKKAESKERERISRFYCKHLACVNNWDLVDLSASQLLGAYAHANRDEGILRTLVLHKNLWHRRIGIVASYAFIKVGNTACTFGLAKLLLDDTEDLMHKATGWMLREAGKVDKDGLVAFLRVHGSYMPRTMLRYAIERLPERERKMWLVKSRKNERNASQSS